MSAAYPRQTVADPDERQIAARASTSSATSTSSTARSSTASSPTATRPRPCARRRCRSRRCRARAGSPSCRGSARRSRRRSSALLETGSIPAAEKLRAKFPPGLIDDDAPARASGPKRARRLYDELGHRLARGAARGRGGASGCAACAASGAKFEETCSPALAAGRRRRGRAARPCCSRGAADRRAASSTALRAAPGRATASSSPGRRGAGRQRQGPRHHRHRRRPRGAAATPLAELRRHRRLLGAGRQRGARARRTPACRSTCASSSPTSSATCSQHFTGSKQHNVALRERAVRAGLHVSRVRAARRRQRRDRIAARPRRRSTSCSACPGSRRSCARTAASSRPRQRHAARRSSTLEDLKGDLHCHTSLSDGRNTIEEMAQAARERGLEYLAITDHSATHGFGNRRVARRSCARRSSASASSTRSSTASSC